MSSPEILFGSSSVSHPGSNAKPNFLLRVRLIFHDFLYILIYSPFN